MSSLKVYVAGCWRDREDLKRVMDEVKARGHRITHDWTTFEASYMDRHERNKLCARKDIEGVVTSDVLLVLLTRPDYAYRGTSSEAGAAMACRHLRSGGGPRIWVVTDKDPRMTPEAELPYSLTTCFMHDADQYFSTVEAALDALGKL